MSVELIEKLGRAFEEFKTANDARLKQIEAQGVADPILSEKVDKLNAEISKVQGELKAEQKRSDELEKQVNRGALGGGGEAGEKEMQHARTFFSRIQRVPAAQAAVDLPSYRAYRSAFQQYLRFGDRMPGIQNALSVGSDPDGGYWVTPDMSGRIVEMVYESSPIRQISTVQTTGKDAVEGGYDLGEAASGWVGEAEARPETGTPQIGEWRIPVHEQYANPKSTQKNLDDSDIDVEAWLARKIADKLIRVENTAFVSGNGVKKPRGFLTYTAGTPSATVFDRIQQIPTGVSAGFGSPNPGDELIDVVGSLKAAYRQGASWVMARLTAFAVRKLKDGQNNYLLVPNFAEPGANTLLGFPVVEAEDMPAIAASSLSIAFGNFREGYLIIDRQGVRVLRDPFTEKSFVHFYTTKRVGGDVVNFEAIKLVKFATS